MHEILVALAFVAMVACSAIVAALPQKDIEDDAEGANTVDLSLQQLTTRVR